MAFVYMEHMTKFTSVIEDVFIDKLEDLGIFGIFINDFDVEFFDDDESKRPAIHYKGYMVDCNYNIKPFLYSTQYAIRNTHTGVIFPKHKPEQKTMIDASKYYMNNNLCAFKDVGKREYFIVYNDHKLTTFYPKKNFIIWTNFTKMDVITFISPYKNSDLSPMKITAQIKSDLAVYHDKYKIPSNVVRNALCLDELAKKSGYVQKKLFNSDIYCYAKTVEGVTTYVNPFFVVIDIEGRNIHYFSVYKSKFGKGKFNSMKSYVEFVSTLFKFDNFGEETKFTSTYKMLFRGK